jgi:hypothetical protein
MDQRPSRSYYEPRRHNISQVASLGKKWIVIRSAAIIIDAENHSRVIRRRTAEIVLQLAIVIQVADDNIQFAIGAKGHGAAIVIGPWRHK